MKKTIIKTLLTLFFIGNLKLMPGTAASLVTLIVLVIVNPVTSSFAYLIFIIVFTIMSILISNYALEIYGKKDPSNVVIDEACGMLCSYFFLELSLLNIVLGFIFFRFFDIIKPWPIRSLQKLPSGLGIVIDDIAAGILTAIILYLIKLVK